MSEPSTILRVIAMTASDAVKKDGRLRCEGVSIVERIDELLQRLNSIERLARSALPEKRLGLPPEARAELVKRLADSILEAADEIERRTRVVH